ncbi:MAG: ATP-binding protein [candidate division WOR-3 bacterium]
MDTKIFFNLSLQNFFKVLDNFSEAVYIVDPESYQILYMNKKLRELLGKEKEENICYKLFQGLSSPCPFCSNKYLYKNPNEPYIWIHRNLRNNRYYKCIDQFFKLENGKYLRIEFAIDITKEIEKNKIIKEYYKRYYDIFENVPVPLYITTTDGRFIRVNKAMSILFGYTKEEFKKINAVELYYNPKDREEFKKNIEKKGYVEDYEVKLKNKEGKVLNCLLFATVRKNLQGEIIGYQGGIKNITLEKEYRELLKKAIKRKDERIKKLIEEKRLKDDKFANFFIYQTNFVHDFNNILGNLLNNYYLIKDYLEKNNLPKIYELLEEGEKFVIKSKALITSLLKIRDEPIKKTISLKSLIEKAINSFEKKEELIVDISIPKDLTIYGYEKQLEILFTNLLKNSWEAKKEEKIKIEITSERVKEKDQEYVKISFTDNGKGIKKEELNKIFQSFHSTKGQMGIGLKIVSEIIKNHNGKIEVESEENKYTRFQIYLPILKEKSSSFKKKIILVGTNNKLIEIVKEILNLFYYEVYWAENWEKAIEIYHQLKEKKESLVGFFYDSKPENLEEDIKELQKIFNLAPSIKIFYSSFITELPQSINHNIILLKKPYTTEELIKTISSF